MEEVEKRFFPNLYKWDPASEGYVMYTSELRKKIAAKAETETAELIENAELL